jgi:hypothetical protein
MKRCKALYQEPDFQAKILNQAPAIAALHRLYQIGVEVNAFQKKELQQCA